MENSDVKVTILGAGVIGVTTAWYLAQAGHAVEVVERRPGPALETSFANAGEISPGYASPWAAPGVPLKALRWLAMRHAPLVLRPGLSPAAWFWLARMLGNCSQSAYLRNKDRMVRLAEYSRDALGLLRAETGIRYDEAALGTLQVFRTAAQLKAVAADVEILRKQGVPYEILDVDGCLLAEPGLAVARDRIVGGLRLPADETGDCFLFTNALAARAEAAGVRFRFDTQVTELLLENGRIRGVHTDKGHLACKNLVLAAGCHSPALLRPLGIRLPVYPVKGYSITTPVACADTAPRSTIMDETYKVAITRLGTRIRVGGIAEISGYSMRLDPARQATLEMSLHTLFPGAAKRGDLSFWSGLRPMTPDGTPIIGPTAIPNLYLNTGHGTLGWTMACGSARLLADIISGKPGAIRSDDLSIRRYG